MTYLITGGSGSLGRALIARWLLEVSTTRVIALARNEHRLAALKTDFPDPRLDLHCGDVRDRDRLRWSLRAKPDVIVHAAAMKRVEVCEANPTEAHQTNILGTMHVCEEAMLAGVPYVMVISSDKAAEPVTFYGKTKAAAEGLAIQANRMRGSSPTAINVARYGNCVDSAGAAWHTFRSCRFHKRPIPITDPGMTRFWWTLRQASDWLADRIKDDCAHWRHRSGNIWIPKLGAAPVMALARAVWPGATFELIGRRGIEKQHEVLLSQDEAPLGFDAGSSFVIRPDRDGADPFWVPLPDDFRYASDAAPSVDFADLLGELAA